MASSSKARAGPQRPLARFALEKDPLDRWRAVLRALRRLNLVRAWEKRDRAICKIRDVNRVGQRIHRCRHRKAAHSLVHDLDVAIIHVPGAAGVSVERRDIVIAVHRDVNDVFVLIDCNAASENVMLRGLFPALSGNAPTRTAGGGDCGQPEVLVPLQVAPSIIETVRSLRFPMKTVFLSNTIPTPTGAAPAGNVATTF